MMDLCVSLSLTISPFEAVQRTNPPLAILHDGVVKGVISLSLSLALTLPCIYTDRIE
jgi:hypothetical protein